MNNDEHAVLPDVLRERCSRNNLKMTPQRVAIYEAVVGNTQHPCADSVYREIQKKFPTISFDTVNRTLATFAKIGLLDVVEGYGDPKRFDPNLRKHHHFRCLHCGALVDVYHADYDAIPVPPEVGERFTVNSVKVLLEGICEQCRTRGE